MNHLERFFATVERKNVDRPATWLGLPTKDALPGLFSYFNVSSVDELKDVLDDDIYAVEMPYHSPTSDAIYAAFDFAKVGYNNDFERTLTAPGFFEDYSEPSAIELFDWPDPEKYISVEECRAVVNKNTNGRAVMAVLWSAHFQDACAAFGMETALVKMILDPDIFKAVIDRITQFYLKANEIFYEATKGKLHAILIGNDFGTQTGLICSPNNIREFAMPGIIELVKQAKGYGLKVIYHSCGAVSGIIDDLILAGVDVIHPIQALATGMEPRSLKERFGDKVSFCGGVDAQNLLVSGKPEDVKEKVNELKNIFKTGLIISPSHEAILPDIKPENIEALFDSVNS